MTCTQQTSRGTFVQRRKWSCRSCTHRGCHRTAATCTGTVGSGMVDSGIVMVGSRMADARMVYLAAVPLWKIAVNRVARLRPDEVAVPVDKCQHCHQHRHRQAVHLRTIKNRSKSLPILPTGEQWLVCHVKRCQESWRLCGFRRRDR